MRNRPPSGLIGTNIKLYGPSARRPDGSNPFVEFSVGDKIWYVVHSDALLTEELQSEVVAWGQRRVSHYQKKDALCAAAIDVRAGTLTPKEFFAELVSVVHEIYKSIGLSESAIKHVLIPSSDVLWRSVKHEIEPPEVFSKIQAADSWILGLARASGAFRIRYTDKIPDCAGRTIPLLETLMLRYHYDKTEPPKVKTVNKSADPIFYPGLPDQIGGFRPWLTTKIPKRRS